MAHPDLVHVAAISTVLSFAYIAVSLERHSLSGHPRLSTLLLFLLSGGVCFTASYLCKWLPGGDGRFANPQRAPDSRGVLDFAKDGATTGSNALVPGRPRRYSLPALIFCVVVRLELFNRVAYQQQCSAPGVESFLCLLLFGYEIFSTRRKYGMPAVANPDDPWRTIFDDMYDWFSGPRVAMLFAGMGALAFAFGTYYSVNQIVWSTYFCFTPLDSRLWVFSLQLIGLVLDAVIAVVLWRVLAWTRTTKLRLRTLGSVLVLSSLSMGLVWLSSAMFQGNSRFSFSFGSLYGFDIAIDSIAFGALTMSAATWICESSPLLPASTLTVFVGIWSSASNAAKYGDWLHSTLSPILVPAWVVVFGAILFMYFHEVKSMFFARRILIVVLLVVFTTIITKKASDKEPPTYPRNPISDLIFKANVAQERWLMEATTSGSLKVAVNIYEERHPQKAPPPNFDKWYEYAQDTLVIDTFDQVDEDLAPFWNFKPEVLRKRADAMTGMPGVSTIAIRDGKVTQGDASNEMRNNDLQELTDIISKFSAHLPDMILPINLNPSPRILPSWEEAHAQGRLDLSAVANLIPKRSMSAERNVTEASLDLRDNSPVQDPVPTELTSPNDFRAMLGEACAPDSKARTKPQWNIAEFCTDCVKRHSKHAFLVKWEKLLQSCEQPDIRNLHEMFMTSPEFPPIRKLMPLFSSSKTDAFGDILIPLPRTTVGGEPDLKWGFDRRYDSLFWRGRFRQGRLNDEALRGSQKYRLLHLFADPSPRDDVTILLPSKDHEDQLGYERVSAKEASNVAPFDLGLEGYSDCNGEHCDLVKQVFGAKEDAQEPLEYRYVLLLDENGSPSPQLMRTVRSNSVPFISTIFRSWYTERLRPYLHFVPVDLRYQSLHSTYLYFTGTEKRAKINGRDTMMSGHADDADWIANEGKKWADKAIGEKDLEVYLFRLLLEWGRLIDDKRDSVGFRKNEGGGFDNTGWTKLET